MSFEDIKGQEDAVRRLKNAVLNNKAAHAYIFAGPRSSGCLLMARNFAKALNCVSSDNAPCDTCVSCVKIDKGAHPDVRILAPGSEDGGITVDQVRSIQSEIILKPYEGSHKVFIIEDAHRMNIAAANSFLKTLEEPPPDSILILITERPSDLTPTIVSRCQIIRALPVKSAAAAPEQRDGILAKFADDKYIESLNLNDKKSLLEDLSVLAGWYRDILVYKTTGKRDLVINSDRLDDIGARGRLAGTGEILTILENILKAREEIENNINPKLALGFILRNE